MAQARLWLWGLIPLAALWMLAIWIETGPVERDIGARATAVLASGAWLPSEVTAQGRDVTLGGDAYDPAERGTARTTTDAVRGVRLVHDHSNLVPEASPYAWSADKDGATLSFDGAVPKPKVKADLFALAGAGGAVVTDTTRFARGAPAGFDAAAALAVVQLRGLTRGKIVLIDDTLSISGLAKNRAARDAIVAALGTLPAGFALGETSVTVPSYDFSATKDPAAGTLTLEGLVPDENAHRAILDVAGGAFAGQKLVDATKLATGAPAGFTESATTALEQLSRLESGKLAVSDTNVALSGTTLYARAGDQIQSALKALPSSFTAKAELVSQPPAASVDAVACQQLFADQLANGKIQFETASAKLDKASAGLLDHLVAIRLRCPAQAIEVSGHTDAKGRDETNMDLSKRRAQAVVDYLVAAGLDATRLTAVGYGKTRPIASNDTEEGMAKNRRIEFLVK